MERAALAVTEEILKARPQPAPVLVVCGSGNNGGDGFAIARLLAEQKIAVEVLFAGKDASMTEECRRQKTICENCNIKIVRNFPEKEYTTIVDALFGIGLSRDVKGVYAELIEKLNASAAYKIAVDIPSGIRSDTGNVSSVAVRADLTVTFAARKLGQVLYPAADFCGKVVCRLVGIPVRKEDAAAFLPGPEDLCRLPGRLPWSNKGTCGKVLLIAGAEGMSGAACFCAEAAYRMGSGLVRVLTPECKPRGAPDETSGGDRYCVPKRRRCKRKTDLCDGVGGCHWNRPGTRCGGACGVLLGTVLEAWFGPLVIDADGLNLLAAHAEWQVLLAKRAKPAVVTPHIGEMARLLRKTSQQVLNERIDCCRNYAKSQHLICVEKDARTVISDGEAIYINTSGNDGMATGGSGDVLTGMICGLLAQGMEPLDAAVFGAYLHGLAGDEAKRKLGGYAMLAGDLIRQIGTVLR